MVLVTILMSTATALLLAVLERLVFLVVLVEIVAMSIVTELVLPVATVV